MSDAGKDAAATAATAAAASEKRWFPLESNPGNAYSSFLFC
jgi:hypothetical protein